MAEVGALTEDTKGVSTSPFSTLYARMLLPFAAVLLAGTVIAWWIGNALLANTLESRLGEQLQQAAEVVSRRDFPLAEAVLARLDKLLQASVYLFGHDGNLLLFGEQAPAAGLRAALQQQYTLWQEQEQEQEHVVTQAHFKVDGRDYLLVLRRFDQEKGVKYSAVAAFSDLSDVRAATRRGGLWLAALAFSAISLVALIGYRVARSITVPVGELAAMAGDIAAGERKVRVHVHRRDEVGSLAQSLNTMAERLAQYEAQQLEQGRLATLGELSARVAHEVRNPLTAIKMQLQLMEDEVVPQAKPRLNAVLDEVDRLELIVASTLQLGRPDRLQRRAEDLNRLVAEVAGLLQPRFGHRGIDIQMSLGSELPRCQLDGARVKQILLNLLNNAAEELQGGGLISLRTAQETSAYLLVEVADSGGGIAADQLGKVLHEGVSDKPAGFGLGLRVTRELVELHGGVIEVGVSDLGGASFRVLFPLEN